MLCRRGLCDSLTIRQTWAQLRGTSCSGGTCIYTTIHACQMHKWARGAGTSLLLRQRTCRGIQICGAVSSCIWSICGNSILCLLWLWTSAWRALMLHSRDKVAVLFLTCAAVHWMLSRQSMTKLLCCLDFWQYFEYELDSMCYEAVSVRLSL